MYTDIFQDLGLTPNEAKIYAVLIEAGETTVGEISIKGKIHRRNVYDAINRLIEKGLVFQILTKGENIYKAVDPAKLLELIREKEDKLKKALPELTKLYQGAPRNQEAFVYRGVEGFKNYLRDILRLAGEGEDKHVYFIGAKGLWFDPKLKIFLISFLAEAKRLGIKYHHIFDSELKNRQDILDQLGPAATDDGQPAYKFFPPEYSTKSACDIFGDHVVTFTGLGPGQIDEDIAIYVLVDQELADGYKVWFGFMWDHIQDAINNKQ